MKNNIITSYIISISFVLLSLLYAVHYCCFDINFYDNQHAKLKLGGVSIAEYIGISDEELSELTSFTLDYLNDYDLFLDKKMNIKGQYREVFTNDEKAHMEDVRRLNINSMYICNFSMIVFIVSFIAYVYVKGDYKMLFSSYLKTLMITFLIFLIMIGWIIIDFDSFWTLFHKIFFTGNDLWLLDLNKEVLIMIVPPDFFNALVLRIIFIFFLYLIVLAIILYFLKKRKRKTYDKYRFI